MIWCTAVGHKNMLIIYIFILVLFHKMIKNVNCLFTFRRNIGINKRYFLSFCKNFKKSREQIFFSDIYLSVIIKINRNKAFSSSNLSWKALKHIFNSLNLLRRIIPEPIKWSQILILNFAQNIRFNNIFKLCLAKFLSARKNVTQPCSVYIAFICKFINWISVFLYIFTQSFPKTYHNTPPNKCALRNVIILLNRTIFKTIYY